MRKKARSYKFSLIILLLLSFLLVIFLLMANNKRKQNQHNRIRQINQAVIYNKSHFNPCVKIYGVDVSKLTIDQASVSYTHLRAHETNYKSSYAVFCLKKKIHAALSWS